MQYQSLTLIIQSILKTGFMAIFVIVCFGVYGAIIGFTTASTLTGIITLLIFYTKIYKSLQNTKKTNTQRLFKDLRGIILLDTLGNTSQLRKEVEQLETGLEILETKYVGCENVKNVIQEAIERNTTDQRANRN